ncbi:MAG: Uma2 family endonuclease [Dehalococcoidia bacterium]
MPVSEKTYQQLVLEDPRGQWELVCGRLRRKPDMTTEHESVARRLTRRLSVQVNEDDFSVGMGSPKLRVSSGSYYFPDVCVLPRPFERKLRETPGRFEVYTDPMSLVVEVWSPSTGDYDVDEKLVEYQKRGDLEIWRIHPYERTLTAWRRRPDGTYAETLYRHGSVQPIALSDVTIEIESLFA